MRLAPFPCFEKISPDKLLSYECSDRIVLSKTYVESMGFTIRDLITIENNHGQSISGTLFEIQETNTNTIFIPSWMFYKLDSLSPINVSVMKKHTCRAIQIVPHSKEYASRADFVLSLNNAIINYHSLTRSTKIPLCVNGVIEFITIEQMLPSNINTFFVFNSGAVSISILPAKMPEKDTYSPFLYSRPLVRKQEPFAFLGIGHLVGGTPSSGNSKEDAAQAARNRLKKYKKT